MHRFLFALLFCFPLTLSAQSPFTGTTGKVSRGSVGLFGGSPEKMDMSDGGNLFVALGAANGIYCSSDGGDTWNGPSLGSDFGSVSSVAVGEDENTAYFVGGIKLYKTADFCSTFTEIEPTDDNPSDFDRSMVYAHDTLLVVGRDGTVYRSTDNGTTLASVTIDGAVTGLSWVAASPTDDVFYALASEGATKKVYQSTDAGASWSAVAGALGCDDCSEIGVFPGDATVLVASGIDEVRVSEDTGATWLTREPAGLASVSLSFTSTRIFVGSQYTEDNGVTWADINDDATTTDTQLSDYFFQDPDDAQMQYMVSLRGFARTTDGGTTWADVVDGLYGVTTTAIAQSTDKDTVYLATNAGLAKTSNYTDSSPTWTYPLEVSGMGDPAQTVLLPDADTPDTVVVSARGTIYRSTNGGTSFTEAAITSGDYENRDSVSDWAVDSSSNIFAGYSNSDEASGGVLTSSDGGATWTDTSLTNSAPVNAIGTLGATVFAGAGSDMDDTATLRGLFQYASGSWSQLSGDFDGHIITDIETIPSTNTIFAVSGGDENASVFRSTDGGTTWSELLNDVLPTDGWFRAVAHDPNNTSTVYVASGRSAAAGTIYQSTDNGETWAIYQETLVDEVPATLFVDGLIAGFGTGLFSYEPLKCKLRVNGSRLIAKYKRGTRALRNLTTTEGMTKTKVIFKNLTTGLRVIKKAKALKGRSVISSASSGTWKATCRFNDRSDTRIKVRSKRKNYNR